MDEEIERQLAALTGRVWRIEQRLGLTEPMRVSPPAVEARRPAPFRKFFLMFIVGFFLVYLWTHLTGTEITGIGFIAGLVIVYGAIALSDRRNPPA